MRSLLLSCVFVLTLAVSAHGKLLTADQIRDVEPLLPYFTWLMDSEGKQGIASVSTGSMQERFAPLVNGIPLKTQGAVWLRLVIIKSPPSPTGGPVRTDRPRLVMRLGELPPGGAQMFVSESPGPVSAQGVWHSETVTSYSDVLLPEPGLLPMSIYLRLDSMPGLWFAPTISPQGTLRPALLPSELLLPGLLIVACAACLLRAFAHRAQWALWAAMFLICVLAQTILPLPNLNQAVSMRELPAMLAPGMALLLLPHVGRRMFQSSLSVLQDAILYLCSIIGVAVCLIPLAPGMAWLSRLFPLWPLLLFPLLPVCVSALANKKPGALAFAGACAMSLLGAGLSLYAVGMPNPPLLAAQGSLWGLAVGGLGLALARIPKETLVEQDDELPAARLRGLAATTPGAADFRAPDWEEPDHSRHDPLPSLEMRSAAPKAPSALSLDISQLARQTREQKNDSASVPDSVSVATGPEGHEETRPETGAAPDAAPPCSLPAGQEEALPAAQPTTAAKETGGGDSGMFWNPEDPAYAYTAGVPASDSASSTPSEHEVRVAGSEGEKPSPKTQPLLVADEAHAGAGALDPSPASDSGREESLPAQELSAVAAGAESRPTWEWDRPAADKAEEAQAAAKDMATEDVDRIPETAPDVRPDASEAPYRPYKSGLLPDFAGSSDSETPSTTAARVISLTDEDFSSYSQPLFDDLEEAPRHTTLTSSGSFLFNLHSLVREVHDTIVPLAKNKGLLFSWYITPSLPSLLEGDAPRLRGALSLLLQNSVQATRQGAVQLAVRKNIGGDEPGDLLFSISDSGSAQRTDAGFFHAWELAARTGGAFNVDYSPGGGTQITFTARFALPSEEAAREHLAGLTKPVRWDDALAESSRKVAETDFSSVLIMPEGQEAIAHEGSDLESDNDEPISVLWERSPSPSVAGHAPSSHLPEEPDLAAMSPEQVLERQGFLEPLPVQAEPASVPSKTGFRSQADLDQPGAIPLIMVAEMTNSKRKLLSHYLADLPHEHVDAANNSQVISLIRERPVSLVIFDADMPEPDIIKTLDTMRQEERRRGQRTAPVLALTNHEAQSRRMVKAGATHTLCKPFSRDGLREVVLLAVPSLGAAMPQAAGVSSLAGTDSTQNQVVMSPLDVSDSASAAPAGVQSTVAPGPDLANTRPPEDPFVAYIRSGSKDQNSATRHIKANAAPVPPPAVPVLKVGRVRKIPAEEPGPEASVSLSEPKGASSAPSGISAPQQESGRLRQEVDLLEAALRDAPAPQGKPVLVSLPSLEKATEPDKEATPHAAPIILGLSEEDVTPHAGQKAGTPLLDLILTGEEVDEAEAQPAPSPKDSGPDSVQMAHAQTGVEKREPSAAEKESDVSAPADGGATAASETALASPDAAAVSAAPDSQAVLEHVSASIEELEKAVDSERKENERVSNAAAGLPAETAGSAKTEPPVPDAAVSFAESPAEPSATGTTDGSPVTSAEIDCSQVSSLSVSSEHAGAAATIFAQPAPQTFSLPGLDGEAVDASLLPLVPGLLHALNDALSDARQGRDSGKTVLVQEAAGRLAGRAEVFGLQKLGKIGRCVERAAEADDLEAVSTLLEDLDIITKRYIVALQESFQSFISVDR